MRKNCKFPLLKTHKGGAFAIFCENFLSEIVLESGQMVSSVSVTPTKLVFIRKSQAFCIKCEKLRISAVEKLIRGYPLQFFCENFLTYIVLESSQMVSSDFCDPHKTNFYSKIASILH